MAGAAEGTEQLQRISIENIHLLVGSIDHERKLLLRIHRKADVPHRSAAERLFREEGFLNERAILSKDLKAIVGAVADIHEAIMRDLHGVNNTELRWGRTGRIVLAWFILVLHRAAEWRRQLFAR
jgi:hypothetical protein